MCWGSADRHGAGLLLRNLSLIEVFWLQSRERIDSCCLKVPTPLPQLVVIC